MKDNMETKKNPGSSSDTGDNFNPGDHLSLIYETEEEHRLAVTSFLRSGLENHQKVIYILDGHRAETIMDYLKEDGIDVEFYLDKGQLVFLPVDRVYLLSDVFDPARTIELLRTETEKALAEGYTALRVTGEMTWTQQGIPGSNRLMEYENMLNDFFPGSQCLAMCQYDKRRFSFPVLVDALHQHPIAMIGTKVYDSLYYSPPSEKNSKKKGMLREKSRKNKFSELRKRAEQVLQNKGQQPETVDPSQLSLEEIREMIHELNVYQVELETQNDELLKLHYDLEAERNRYYDLYDLAPIGYFTLDRQGRIEEINLTGTLLLGLERTRMKGKPLHDFICHDFQDIYFHKWHQILKTKIQQTFEVKMKKADGTEFYAQLEYKPLCDMEGNATHIRGVIVDINGLKLAEEQIKNSLQEKELLLKEIHHRVRNNLTLVSSLLSLQSQTARDPTVDRVFQSCKNRIQSMALVHEILYDSEDLTKIDFSRYIKELLKYLSLSYTAGKTQPTLEIRTGDIKMPINKAIPCGLIINELTTNAFKYAFTGNRAGEIRIEFDSKDDKSCLLLIGDNGVGLPADLDPKNTKSFGFTLVNLLVKQLRGSYEIDGNGGTTFKITFPRP